MLEPQIGDTAECANCPHPIEYRREPMPPSGELQTRWMHKHSRVVDTVKNQKKTVIWYLHSCAVQGPVATPKGGVFCG